MKDKSTHQRGKERALELRRELDLRHLNIESGHFALHGKSNLAVEIDGASLPASNVIYLMLDADEPINYLQWLASDDIQVLIEGGPADYYLFHEDGRAEKVTMGRDLSEGQQLIVHAPAATTKAIVLHDNADYVLVGSVVTPAWSPTRVRIGADQAFVDRYERVADWATSEHIRFLAGPEFGEIIGGAGDQLHIHVSGDGEILFQGMQLSLEQAMDEIRQFSQRQPGAEFELTTDPAADPAITRKLQAMGSGPGAGSN